jgi:folate-binding protein YgfZ
MRFMAPISNRGVLSITGEDAKKFLQGLITNDIHQVSETNAIYTAFLTPQGKFLYDFFITERLGVLFLEVEKDRLEDLQKRLKLYKLKADVEVDDVSDLYQIWAFWGDHIEDHFNLTAKPGHTCIEDRNLLYTDPRCSLIGVRGLLYHSKKAQHEKIDVETQMAVSIPGPLASIADLSLPYQKFLSLGFQKVEFEVYDHKRLQEGLPDGSRDMIIERAIPLECGLEDLQAISWTKGCYMGQELTARTKHRGLVRKRYFPVKFEGAAPAFGTKIMQEEEEVGELYSSNGSLALARLKLEAMTKKMPLMANHQSLRVIKPKWMVCDDIIKNIFPSEGP